LAADLVGQMVDKNDSDEHQNKNEKRDAKHYPSLIALSLQIPRKPNLPAVDLDLARIHVKSLISLFVVAENRCVAALVRPCKVDSHKILRA
jgi:hypothetical protein